MKGYRSLLRVLSFFGLVCLTAVAVWLWMGNRQMRNEIQKLQRIITQLDRSTEEAKSSFALTRPDN